MANGASSAAVFVVALGLAGGCSPDEGDDSNRCPEGQDDCGFGCIDIVSNNVHCGGCDQPCALASSCINGQCTCHPGLAACSNQCADLMSDGSHCGACNSACPVPLVCANATCSNSCPAEATQCGNSCVDLNTNSVHCGACNRACLGGQACANAACGCPLGRTLCSNVCVDTATDPANCGSCGNQCAAGAVCSAGSCLGSGTGGSTGSGGSSGDGGPPVVDLPHFSFFVTSLEAMRRLSANQNGFGGDLRYGEADGLTGADKICTEIAETVMPGAGQKQWRAFLSVTAGPDGSPVNAIDRVGNGPWYDRMGRLLALTREDLANPRPLGADPTIVDDLPNEYGTPNHNPDGLGEVDNHDVLTGSTPQGTLATASAADICNNWTSVVGSVGQPDVGHCWPARGRENWMGVHTAPGCAPGVNLVQEGIGEGDCVGCGGGYGAIYCFALMP